MNPFATFLESVEALLAQPPANQILYLTARFAAAPAEHERLHLPWQTGQGNEPHVASS